MEKLTMLKQLADNIASEFGNQCEVVIHDLKNGSLEHSIAYIVNGHVTNRSEGDGPSEVVLDALRHSPEELQDQSGYLNHTRDGKILRSSTMYLRGASGSVEYIFAINYDISKFIVADAALKSLIVSNEKQEQSTEIPKNVNELLEQLIEKSVELVGKPVSMMSKDDKVAAIKFLNESGAFLITRSGDKVSNYFGISKYTLYSYIDKNK